MNNDRIINLQTFAVSSLVFLLLFLANKIQSLEKKPFFELDQEDISYTLNQDFLNIFSMGQQRLMASYLWVYTLLQSDIKHHKLKDRRSWMYIRFNTIAKLDPRFYENYKVGGLYLSIVKDDVLGAIKLLEKGLKHYPKDFWLNYYLGFSYLYELGNRNKGIFYFEKIKDHPMTKQRFPNFHSTLARLHAEKGDWQTAFIILQNAKQSVSERFLKKHFEHLLYSLRAKIDLKCLNESEDLQSCSKTDLFNKPYYKDSQGIYRAKGKILPLNLNLKKR